LLASQSKEEVWNQACHRKAYYKLDNEDEGIGRTPFSSKKVKEECWQLGKKRTAKRHQHDGKFCQEPQTT